jgi:hypothetical protein
VSGERRPDDEGITLPPGGRYPTTPAPGGRTRDAREEIARALEKCPTGLYSWEWYAADAVLAAPAVADALALRGRVEALAERWDRVAAGDLLRERVVHDLRRALDGQP